MAKLPKTFDVNAVKIQSALSEGRDEDAKTIAIELLSSGDASAQVQAIVTKIIRPMPRGKGRPKEQPKHWFEIGTSFEVMMSEGKLPGASRKRLAMIFGYSLTHIRNAIRFFDEARAADAEDSK